MAELNEIFAVAKAVSGPRIAFDREDRHNHQNSHTFYSWRNFKPWITG